VLTYWRFDDLSLLLGLRDEIRTLSFSIEDYGKKVTEIQDKIEQDKSRALDEPADGLARKGIEAASKASWLIIFERDGSPQPLATAFPGSETEMITNAHVATQVAKLLKTDKVFVASPGEASKHYRVVDVRIHPGYEAFKTQIDETPPGVVTPEGEFKRLDLPGAYDVAVLELEAGAKAGPVLPLDRHVEVVENVAFAGYLLRDISGAEAAPLAPVQHVHFGTISALTNFFTFASDSDWEHAQLVHNTIPITGGASGSPIVNMNGEVVAVVSSGEVLSRPSDDADATAPAQPSAVLVNYAQRIDLIDDLLGPDRDFDAKRERAFWQQQLARLSDHHKYAVGQLLAEAERHDSREFEPVGEPIEEEVEQGLDFNEFELSLEKGRSYAIMAYSAGPEGVALTVNAGESELASKTGRPAQVIFTADRDGAAAIVAVTSAAQKSSFELRVYRTD
jgi:hypothetical protein